MFNFIMGLIILNYLYFQENMTKDMYTILFYIEHQIVLFNYDLFCFISVYVTRLKIIFSKLYLKTIL